VLLDVFVAFVCTRHIPVVSIAALFEFMSAVFLARSPPAIAPSAVDMEPCGPTLSRPPFESRRLEVAWSAIPGINECAFIIDAPAVAA